MIELLVAVAVASQDPEIPVTLDTQTTSFVAPADGGVALAPNLLLDPSLPFVIVPASAASGGAPTVVVTPAPAVKAATAPERPREPTGPEDDLALLAAGRDDGNDAAPEWEARPRKRSGEPSFGGGADLSRVATQVSRADSRLRVDKRQVKLEVYRPDGDGARPAVLLLHGASGMGNGAFYRGAAESFAEAGYIVYLPHYLGDRNRNRPRGRALIREFEQQHDTVRAALDAMAADPRVDPTRLAAFGFSLGGFQALGLSSRDKRLAAVVNMGGGMPGNVESQTTRLAPTLVIHGQRDRTVPVARAHRTRDLLRKLAVPHEIEIVRDQPHFFKAAASRAAIERSIAFFDRQMRAPEPVATVDLLKGK